MDLHKGRKKSLSCKIRWLKSNKFYSNLENLNCSFFTSIALKLRLFLHLIISRIVLCKASSGRYICITSWLTDWNQPPDPREMAWLILILCDLSGTISKPFSLKLQDRRLEDLYVCFPGPYPRCSYIKTPVQYPLHCNSSRDLTVSKCQIQLV